MISQKYFYSAIFVIVLIFIAVRVVNILSFPIFNDEGLYVQYAQLISGNWDQYKYVSIENSFQHWKPPLQYWIGAIFIPIFEDPLLATRMAILLFSIIGFIGVFLTALNLYGEKAAIITSLLFALAPAAVFYNIQFIAEGFIFSAAALLLFALIRILQVPVEKIRFREIILTIISGAAIMLFKQTGAVYFLIFLLTPIFFYWGFRKNIPKNIQKDIQNISKKEIKQQREKKDLFKRIEQTYCPIQNRKEYQSHKQQVPLIVCQWQ